jgi:hypothetical protein
MVKGTEETSHTAGNDVTGSKWWHETGALCAQLTVHAH